MEIFAKTMQMTTIIGLILPYIIEDRLEDIYRDVADQYATEQILAANGVAPQQSNNGILCIKL